MFQDNAVDQNRNMVIADLQNLAAKAQQYYAKPTTLGGGGNSFFELTGDATGLAILAGTAFTDNANGTYTILTAGTAAGTPAASAKVFLEGVGKTADASGGFPKYKLEVKPATTVLTKEL
jgi:hypothetical protein